MPVPPHVAAEARRCLARFRLPAELKRPCPPRADVPSRGETEPAAPGCREPNAAGAATATPERPRPTIAGDAAARADGGRPSNNALWSRQLSLFRSSRPSTLGHRVMPPLFPSRSDGSEFVGGPVKESQPEKEEEPFSHHSERDVYQEYLESISRKCGQQDLPEGVMSISLYKYQKMALDWMLFRENSSHCAGGILADQQGLGKTIQVIALILKERAQQSMFMSIDSDREATIVNKEPKDLLFHQKSARHVTNSKPRAVDRISTTAQPAGGTLLVCPKCIVTQWNEELSQKITKDAGLSVLVYHGCSRTMDSKELTKHDVIITTYKMVKQHFNSRKKGLKKKLSASDGHNSNPIAGVRWFRIVLDEAHEIKNCDSLVAQACWELEAERRWCISGTPMQNKFDDLYSYLRFLRYKPYSEYSSFCSLLKKQNSTYASHGKTKLEILLGIVLLQRTKDTLIDGEPIIKLPPKTIQKREIIFTPAEQEFHSWLVQCYEEILMDYTFDQILALLKEHQLACDHPCLVKSRIDYEQCSTIFERSYVSSKMKAIIDILNSIVNKHAFTESDSNIESSTIESAPEKVLVFSQFTTMLDLLQPLLSSNGIQFRRLDGKMNRKARDEAVKDFNRNPEVTVLLASLKAAGVGLNLAAASHVIITDPWWNPFIEDQAIGRAHRIGQTRLVTVYRLVVKGTIEERVLQLQEMKRKNVKRVYDGNILSDKLTEEDLRFLFDGTRQS